MSEGEPWAEPAGPTMERPTAPLPQRMDERFQNPPSPQASGTRHPRDLQPPRAQWGQGQTVWSTRHTQES